MPTLVLSLDGVALREVPLSKDRTTIGRRSHNDLVIDNLAVSGEHAVMFKAGDDFYIEDLGSTNGTTVNGQPVKKHVMQGGDIIEIGKYRLKFVAEEGAAGGGNVDFDTSQPLRREFYGPGPATIPVRQPSSPEAGAPAAGAMIRILSGANVGRELPLVKALTTGADHHRPPRLPGRRHHPAPVGVLHRPRRGRRLPHRQRPEPRLRRALAQGQGRHRAGRREDGVRQPDRVGLISGAAGRRGRPGGDEKRQRVTKNVNDGGPEVTRMRQKPSDRMTRTGWHGT